MKKKIAVLALSFTLLIALTGMANAQPTQIVGSWKCYDNENNENVVFLVSFNAEGVFTASPNLASVSVNHGVWKRTGLNTFDSTDFAFIYDDDGNAVQLQKTNAETTMSDNNNLTAEFDITITNLDGTVVDEIEAAATCERIQVE